MSIDIICCCCTCIFSLVVAAYTFYKTKKLHFFNAYFEKKANAYNEFFDAISHFPFDEIQATPEFTAALHKITLYASDEALQHLEKILITAKSFIFANLSLAGYLES